MIDKFAQEQVRKIVRESGRSILQDTKKFTNLLKDYLPNKKLDTFLLWKILEVGFPQALVQGGGNPDPGFFQTWFQTVTLKLRFIPSALADGLIAWTYGLELEIPPEVTRDQLVAGLSGGQLPPLNNKVILTLNDLVRKYGQTVCFAQNWLEARLKKTFPHQPGEIFLLVFLLERRIPQELVKESRVKPMEILLPGIETKLSSEAPIDPRALRWGTEGWAQSLGLEIPRDSPSLPPPRQIRTIQADRPPAEPITTRTSTPSPVRDVGVSSGNPASTPPPEEPLLRAPYVYILILTTCGLLLNYSDNLQKEARRAQKAFPATATRMGDLNSGNETATTPESEELPAPDSILRLDPSAAFRVGRMFFTGEDGPADKARARKYFWMAARQGSRAAKVHLVFMLGSGEGGEPDSPSSFNLLDELAPDIAIGEARDLLRLFRTDSTERAEHEKITADTIKSRLFSKFPKLAQDALIAESPPIAPLSSTSELISYTEIATLPSTAPPSGTPSPTTLSATATLPETTASEVDSRLLFSAISDQNLSTIDSVLASDPQAIGRIDASGTTPLHSAVSTGNSDIVNLLLKAGANPSAPDRDGLTPLHHAAYLGLDKIGKRLLEMRAKANIQGRQGWTPLHEAAYSGKLGFCKLLLSYGADPNIENNSGNKPLHLAYYQNRKECANLLRPLTRSISLGQSAAPGDQGPAGTVDEPGRSGKLGR